MTRVLVTGAGGFLGRAAVAALEGHDVLPVTRADADLLDPPAADRLVRAAGATHLLHLAWTTEHGRFWDDPANDAWEQATVELVESFAAAGGQRTVLAGTCAQYDWSALDGPANEVATPRRPGTRYGRAKQRAAERAQRVGIPFATGLVFFPYGPGDQPARLVPSVIRSLAAGEEARVSAGSQVRDFIHVADVGAALAALLLSGVLGDVNVGTGDGHSVAEVATTVARIVGREDLLRLGAIPATDDAPSVVADVTRLREEVGFRPRYALEEGLLNTVTAFGAGSRPARR